MKSCLQNLIPQRFLSRLLGKLANLQLGFITQWAIKKFIAHYKVNLTESKITDYREFKTFNDFFTRELKSGARHITPDENTMISPVDGCISELGIIEKDKLLQAKGAYFNLLDLCAGDKALNKTFENGSFLTIYLAPKDYHRFHMPISGKLLQMIYVPGKLYSVNPASVQNIPGLFSLNERVICIFETAIGKMAFIAVGAMIVGSISMNWHGIVAPSKNRGVTLWNYTDQNIILNKGDGMGHFRLGSTVIILCQYNKLLWDSSLSPEKMLKLGMAVGVTT